MKLQEKVRTYLKEKGLPTDIALAFPDVFIVGRKSEVNKRTDIKNLSAVLAGNVIINIPLVSANMLDVTDARMAIALARLGGCGFIPQFDQIESRIAAIKKVKRAESDVIESPITITKDRTLQEARKIMQLESISGLPVVDADNKLLGILTTRDIVHEDNYLKKVGSIMTPMPLITGSPETIPEEAREIFRTKKIEKLPLVDKDGILRGLMTSKDVRKSQNAARDQNGRLIVGAAVGISNPERAMKEIGALLQAGADVILIDTARAFSERVKHLTRMAKKQYNAPIIVGNVDCPEGALMLINAGADGVKVGIGPGSACKTRVETGIGCPQLSAIAECVAIAREYNIPIIADGGIRTDADLSKAICSGAHSVMLGSQFAGVEESPGEKILDGGKIIKIYRGSASIEAQVSRIDQGNLDRIRPSEGVPRRVECSGGLDMVVKEMLGHLRSSMSYAGAFDLEQYRRDVKFKRQSAAGYEEGIPKK